MSRWARSTRWCALRCKKISRKFLRASVRRWFSSLTIWRKRIYFADDIVLMNEGRIVQKGTIIDLRERPADPFVSEFINAQRGIASV
jgi:ABC-type spermidine/putrescine transport systems, ATPase components